ncbi:hypothetical protein FNH22_08410 [Fulvivirga sp. M361]|uniref:glycoside hydrolase family 3 N-terminal domain-containing protein n=1 Tax=Fulvivirga sp. M361 TaxID=2594266 RepID=UPI00117A4A3B|nr:glycoside hydrolase family 3 N-terminal domain-containing protein [Fulvivirga sp. M361]TRX60062.1 hypothetical protein FNH22_08410 [Fulvivirga sp. M361]
MNRYYILLIALLFIGCEPENNTPAYRDKGLAVEARVADLLSRMTLEEKAKQLDMYSSHDLVTNGRLSIEKMDKHLNGIAMGSIRDYYPESAEAANEVQKYIIENTRLGIPALIIEESLHGYVGHHATAFPVPIGISSTWDVELIEKIGKVIGTEARSVGVHLGLSPVLGLGREPRWGRIQETFGEDPYLAARSGVAMVKGMQGEDLSNDDAIVAEPKHYGIHSIPEGGKNTAPVYIGEREARSNFLYVFEKAFKEAGALGAMAAYHDWDGIPASADPWLLKDLLRDEWGFKGMVISDLGAINRLQGAHFTAETPKEAITASISAGMDMQFYDYAHDTYQQSIIDGVNDQTLKIEDLDRAVSSVLYVKFRLGLFENSYTDTALKAERYHCKAHQGIALESGQKSITLLQNKDNVLPLSNDMKNIALIGELAGEGLLGGYSPKSAVGVPITEAFKDTQYNVEFVDIGVPGNYFEQINTRFLFTKKGEQGIDVEYFNNADLSGNPALTRVEYDLENDWHNNTPAAGISSDNFSIRYSGYIVPEFTGIYAFDLWADDLGKLTLDGKVVIDSWNKDFKRTWSSTRSKNEVYLEKGKKHFLKLEMAELDEFTGIFLRWKFAANKGESMFEKAAKAAKRADVAVLVLGEKMDEVGEGLDKVSLELNTYSKQLLNEVAKSGTPIVLVLQNGRPIVLTEESEKVDAIVETWYAGEFCGPATVDVLTGKVNPSGKLPVSFPHNSGQIPIYYNHKRSANRTYVDGNNQPLFAFGHGLSYSKFEYTDLKIAQAEIAKDQNQKVSCRIKNVSDRKGTEVVQLYITDSFSSVTTPVMQLRGFKRVELDAGQEKVVEFVLLPDDLALWNAEMKRVVEPGEFKVKVGAASDDIKLTSTFRVK